MMSSCGKGIEANVDWILEPTGLTVEEMKKHPAGYDVEGIRMPPYEKYRKSGFPHTPSGKMELASTVLQDAGLDALPTYKEPLNSPASTPELAGDFPLILTTGSRLPMYIPFENLQVAQNKGPSPRSYAGYQSKRRSGTGESPREIGSVLRLRGPR